MTLLHFRRTFIEKLFAIHGKIERLKHDGREEVLATLRSDEYQTIREDYDEKSRAFFAKSYRPPDNLQFADSDALFPPDELRQLIEPDYERERNRLFIRPHPPFDAVLERLQSIRELL